MLCKEGFSKVNQIRDDLVVGIRPEGCKFKAVAGLALLGAACRCFFDSVAPGAIGVVLGVCAIGDDKNLHILEQAATSPEAVPLIPLDLVESLPDGDTAPFQLHMNQRQTVHQYRDIVAVIIGCTFCLANHILIDDL